MKAGDRHARRRGWAAAGTIAVHLLVLAWLATRPKDPPPPEPLVLQEIEIWDAAELPPTRAAEPAPPTTAEDRSTQPPPDEEPALDEDDAPRPTSDRHPRRAPADAGRPLDGEGAARPPTGDASAAEGAAAVSPPGALAISGLRRHSRSGGVTVERPTLDPPTHSRNLHDVGSDAVFSPEPSDVKPSSIAAAGFKPRRRDGKLVYKHRKFRAVVHPDGRMTFSDLPSALPSKVAPPQKGMAWQGKRPRMPGLAEGLIAASGQELYVKEKRRLMEWTYELRVQMAIEFAEANIEKRLKSLYRELITRWHAPGGTPETRREEIFDRWDECEESFSPRLPDFVKDAPASIDKTRREAGRAARETIEKFVRTHLPEGGTDAFTAEELRRLNARRKSRAKFDPYAGSGAAE